MITGELSPKHILEGIFLGAVNAGIDLRFPNPGVARWSAQAWANAAVHTVVHQDGDFVQNVLVAFAAHAVADTLMPVVPASSANTAASVQQVAQTSYPSLLELSMRGTVHAVVEAGTAAVLRASPSDIMDLVIAGVGGMTGPLARAAGQALAARTVARRSQVRQIAALKQQMTQVSEETSQALAIQGIELPAETIKRSLQKHPALQDSPEQVQARLIAIGQQQNAQLASSSAAPRSMADHFAADAAWVLNSTLNTLVSQAHAMKTTESQPSKTMVPMYNRNRGARTDSDRMVSSSLSFDPREHLNVSLGEAMLVSAGSCIDQGEKGLWQLQLIIREKLGLLPQGFTQAYTPFMNAETALYARTPVAMSMVGQVTKTATDFGLACLVPAGAGLKGVKLILGASTTGGILSGIQVTPDGLLSTRLENAALGAVVTGATTYGLGVVGNVVSRPLVKLYDARRAAPISKEGMNVSSPNLRVNPSSLTSTSVSRPNSSPVHSPNVGGTIDVIEDFLGKDFKYRLNVNGDPVFMNAVRTLKIRFDIKSNHGVRTGPHAHIQRVIGHDKKGTPIWGDYYPDQHQIHLRQTLEAFSKPKP